MTISPSPFDRNPPKTKLPLAANDVHIWTTKPDVQLQMDNAENEQLIARYTKLLTAKELMKQQRYRFKNDRHDALITRAFVRDLLSYYADVAPEDWQFEAGEKGKPELINSPLPLRFNLSHTKGLIICAVTLEDDIGIDVENITRSNDVLAIANRYFSARECEELFALPVEQQRSRFFDYWTLKESYIKAWGLGLSIPLKDFSFSFSHRFTDDADGVTDGVAAEFTEQGLLRNDITIGFAKHRDDDAQVWRNWLYYPSDEHRIAISLRAKENNQTTDYRLRFFESIPLIGMTALTEHLSK